MRRIALAAALSLACLPGALAQKAVPDIRGTWSGLSRALVIGAGAHHPGAQSLQDPPRISEQRFTFEVQGQDGTLAWGVTSSESGYTEPFAWVFALDGKTIYGADLDGTFRLQVLGPDRMEMCYTHPATSPSKSIAIGCYAIERQR